MSTNTTPIGAGVDISKWQGVVNFKQLKTGKILGHPISFVLIRFGVGLSGLDVNALANIKGALEAGLDVGLYHYSYAKNAAEAKAEAELTLKAFKANNLDGKIAFPLAFDFEEPSVFKLGKATCTEIAKSFLDTIKAAGYCAMLYTGADAFNNCMNRSQLKDYPLWIAGYISESALRGRYAIADCAIWQFGVAGHPKYDLKQVGKVPGVSGQCDCDLLYEDLAAQIKAAGLNGYKPNIEYSVTAGGSKVFKTKAEAEEYVKSLKEQGLTGEIAEVPVAAETPAEIPEAPAPQPAPLKIEKGDVVDFTGHTHYASSDAKKGVATKPGKVKVTLIAKGAPHPYHVIAVNKNETTAYGWVDYEDLVKS